jgi:hypothetical protein
MYHNEWARVCQPSDASHARAPTLIFLFELKRAIERASSEGSLKVRFVLVTAAIGLAVSCQSAPEVVQTIAPPSDEIIQPPWAASGPAPGDYLRVYPPKALRLGIESRVHLDCVVRDDLRLDCSPEWEEYPDLGFGAAGVEVSRLFVVRADYSSAVKPGAKVSVPVAFRLADE